MSRASTVPKGVRAFREAPEPWCPLFHIAKTKWAFLGIFNFRISGFVLDVSKRAGSNVGIELVLLEPKNFL